MGNCQAAEVATVVIEHPGGSNVERIYWSVRASEVMNSNPGHYVAMITAASGGESGVTARQLKLLRPDDNLLMGQVYRLITFEDVLKEFSAKKSVKLGKLLKESSKRSRNRSDINSGSGTMNGDSAKTTDHDHDLQVSSGSRSMMRHHSVGGQWRPALQTIAELGA